MLESDCSGAVEGHAMSIRRDRHMKFTDKQIEEEIESYDNCPPVYQGAIAYLYEILGDRKFEVLLYSIFKRKSKGVEYKSRFDDIALMTGVGEQGRDCAFFYHGDSVGLIQCKHSINPAVRVDKPTVACEIIKFILSYLLDRSLITDVVISPTTSLSRQTSRARP